MYKSNNFSFELIKTALALLIAYGIVAVIIFCMSEEALTALELFLFGPLYSLRRFGNVLEMAIPLVFTGVGLCIIFQSYEFNISVSGVFVISAVATAVVAIFIPLPSGLSIFLPLMIGAVVGAFFTLIPGILKVKWGASELVTSLMLNYILYQLASYIINYHAKDLKSVAPVSLKFLPNTLLPILIPGTRVHMGLLVAVATIIFLYVFLYRTKWGYAIRMVGLNKKFAKYSGININRIVLLAQLIGGGVIGLGGGVEMLGMYKRYQWQIIPSFGFDGIVVALLAYNNPTLVPITALLLAYMRTGTDIMSRFTDVPNEIVYIIQAVVIMIIVSEKFLSKWRYKRMLKDMNINDKEVA